MQEKTVAQNRRRKVRLLSWSDFRPSELRAPGKIMDSTHATALWFLRRPSGSHSHTTAAQSPMMPETTVASLGHLGLVPCVCGPFHCRGEEKSCPEELRSSMGHGL